MSRQLRIPRVTTEQEYTRTRRTLKPATSHCDNCTYPTRCKQDRTCWAAEKEAVRITQALGRFGTGERHG